MGLQQGFPRRLISRVHRYRAEWALKLLRTYADAALNLCRARRIPTVDTPNLRRAQRIPTVNTPNLRRAQRIPTENGGDVAS